jgi:hypothetical protein
MVADGKIKIDSGVATPTTLPEPTNVQLEDSEGE